MASHVDVNKLTTMMRFLNMEPRDRFDDAFVNKLSDYFAEFNIATEKNCSNPESFDEAVADLEKALQEKLNLVSTVQLEKMRLNNQFFTA